MLLSQVQNPVWATFFGLSNSAKSPAKLYSFVIYVAEKTVYICLSLFEIWSPVQAETPPTQSVGAKGGSGKVSIQNTFEKTLNFDFSFSSPAKHCTFWSRALTGNWDFGLITKCRRSYWLPPPLLLVSKVGTSFYNLNSCIMRWRWPTMSIHLVLNIIQPTFEHGHCNRSAV